MSHTFVEHVAGSVAGLIIVALIARGFISLCLLIKLIISMVLG
jgi:hypothetical protein